MLRIAWKPLLFRAAAVGFGLIALLLVLELGLRLLPVNDGLGTLAVNAREPVLRFEPNRQRTWSRGWDFAHVNRVHVNNAGFVHDHDYDPAASEPLLAIVGDSYVEAAMIPFLETGAGRLGAELEGRARVYTFGASGAALSQYLVYAEHARDRYAPDGLAVVVVGNDFDESLLARGGRPGFHYFVDGENGRLKLSRVDLAISPVRRLVRHSALAMYAVTQLELTALPSRIGRRLRGERTETLYAGNTARQADAERVHDGKRAIEAFVEQLPARAGLPPQRIAIVLDAIRPDLYEGTGVGGGSFFDLMRRHLLERGRQAGFEMIDLETTFAAHHAVHGERFEFPDDGHWNALGHRLLFETLRDSSVVGALEPASTPAD